MAKKKRRNSFDTQHLKNLSKTTVAVSNLYTEAQRELINIGLLSNYHGGGLKLYTFSDYPELNKLVNARLKQLRGDIVNTIRTAEADAWELANKKNDALVKSVAAMTHIDIKNFDGCLLHNLDALAAFQSRKINGMGLSPRVWKMCTSFKSEVELALSVGMKDGKSADEMSKDVRNLLKYPDKLFRRVRDENGNLQLSKAAKAFHPGTGVYRSSYKNALRLAATESNMAYRTAEYERWQQLPFVVGVEIGLSNNHPDPDVCDDLAGVYPKGFKFVGWHPFCRCIATAKLANIDDFEKYLSDNDMEDYTPKAAEVVSQCPKGFYSWVTANGLRIAKADAASLPYFLRDNKAYWSGASNSATASSATTAYVTASKAATDGGTANLTDVYNAQALKKLETLKQWSAEHKQYKALATAVLKAETAVANLKGAKLTPEIEFLIMDATDKQIAAAEKLAAAVKPKTVATDPPLSQKRKDNALWDKAGGYAADKALRPTAGKAWMGATEKEKDVIYNYTGDGYSYYNRRLRDGKFLGNVNDIKAQKESIKAITDYINRNALPSDMWVQRGEKLSALESRITASGGKMPSDLNEMVGMEMREPAFLSTAVSKGLGFDEDVILNIYLPKGTKAAYVEPISACGKGAGRDWDGKTKQKQIGREAELIIQRGANMRITKVERANNHIYIDCELIGITPADLEKFAVDTSGL